MRHPIMSWLVSVVGFAGCGTAVETIPATSGPHFQQQEFVTDETGRQTVLTGFFMEGPVADFVIVHRDDDGTGHLRIHSLIDDSWALAFEAPFRSEVLFVDVLRLGDRDRLIGYETGQLFWFEPESGTNHPLARVTASFTPPRTDEIPNVDVTHDVNDDGREDLVLPGTDGFWVLVQDANAGFADAVKVGPVPNLSGITGADGYRYDPWSVSRIHRVDTDGDGRRDLVSWTGDRLVVHEQREDGSFSQETAEYALDIAVDSDDLFSLATGDMTGRVLHSFHDLNGDTTEDLVIASLQGDRLSSKRSTYEVHLGHRARDGAIEFSADADVVFESPGRILLGFEPRDLNQDGVPELLVISIDREKLKGSLWKSLKGFMGDDIGLFLEFHSRSADGTYATPAETLGMALDGVPSHREPGSVPLDLVLRGATHEQRRTQKIWPKAFNATRLIGDVNGDGVGDLILGDHPRQLAVFAGAAQPELFTTPPDKVRVQVPNDEEYVWLFDLNRDGKQDIVLHQPVTARDGHGAPLHAPGTEPHRITVLIAQ